MNTYTEFINVTYENVCNESNAWNAS